MKNLFKLFTILVLLPGFSLPAAASWTGPQATITNKNGRKVITICDQGGSCTSSTPFFLAINSQNSAIANHDWSTFMYEAQLQLNYVNASANGIIVPTENSICGLFLPFERQSKGPRESGANDEEKQASANTTLRR